MRTRKRAWERSSCAIRQRLLLVLVAGSGQIQLSAQSCRQIGVVSLAGSDPLADFLCVGASVDGADPHRRGRGHSVDGAWPQQ